jgi:hypothetical protein
MSNIFDMENSMSRLSFQEKMLYAQLLGLVVVVVFYAHYLVHQPPGQHWFHAVILGLILLFAAFRMLLRRRSGNTVQDERDRSIAAIGTRWSNVILWVGLVAMLVMYWDHGGLHSKDLMVGIIFHLLVLAASARIVRELVAYRMAA